MAIQIKRNSSSMISSVITSKLNKYIILLILLVYINYLYYNNSYYEDTSSLNKFINDDNIKSTYIISYAVYAPYSSTINRNVHKVCRQNLDIFISRAVVHNTHVKYYFLLAGDTIPTTKLKKVSTLSNVNILNVENDGIDILSHLKLLKSLKRDNDYFILLNCGCRGPYFDEMRNTQLPSLNWLSVFTSKLKDDVALVGPTINFESSPHVQTYALAFSNNYSGLILDYWNTFDNVKYNNNNNVNYNTKERESLIYNVEVGLSKHILESGFNIASLDSRHEFVDFRKLLAANEVRMQMKKLNLYDADMKDELIPNPNPTLCIKNYWVQSLNKTIGTLGCDGLEPCEVVFVKYGGAIIQKHLVSSKTKGRIDDEDKNVVSNNMCGYYEGYKFRPSWDAKELLSHASVYTISANAIGNVDLVFIVRAYSKFTYNLLALLYLFEAQTDSIVNFQVIVIPTDEESMHDIKQVLTKQWFNPLVHHRIQVSLIQFPSWIYKQYGSYIETLCTDGWIQSALKIYPSSDIARHCNVNSPLHYLLVDITLEYVNAVFNLKPFWIVITNADNYYIPQFFQHLTTWKDTDTDVLMVNMVHKGHLFPTSFEREKTDLGAYAIKSDFLSKTSALFLKSLPLRCNAKHYHDADGHFIENLISLNAKVQKIEAYLFAQN